MTTIEHQSTDIDTSTAALYLRDTKLQIELKEMLTRSMKDALKNEKIEAALIPGWDVGCRRLAPDTGYLTVSYQCFPIETGS
jgi:hypothetical protein